MEVPAEGTATEAAKTPVSPVQTTVTEEPESTVPSATFKIHDFTSTFNKKVAVIYILVALFGVGVLTYTVVLANDHSFSLKRRYNVDSAYCRDVDCYRTAYTALSSMNNTLDPCENFYKFACDRYTKNDYKAHKNVLYEFKFQETPRSELQEDVEQKLYEAITHVDPLRQVPWAYENQVKRVYDACADHHLRSKHTGKPLLDHINKNLGGWHRLNTTWTHFDVNDAIMKMFSKVGVPIFFDLDLGVFRQFAQRRFKDHEIVVGSSYSHIYSYPGIKKYTNRSRILVNMKTLAVDVFKMFYKDCKGTAISATAEANNFAENVIEIESELSDIATSHWNDIGKHVSEMEQELNFLDISAVIDGAYAWPDHESPRYELANIYTFWSHYVYVKYPKALAATDAYLKQLNDTADGVGIKKLNDYFVWRLLYKLLPELPANYQLRYHKYVENVRGWSEMPPTWYTCMETLKQKMPDALSGVFVKKHFSTAGKRIVREMAEDLRTSILEDFEDDHWMSPETRKNATAKIAHLLPKVGHPAFMDNATLFQNILDKLYKDLTSSDDHLSNMIGLNRVRIEVDREVFWHGLKFGSHWRGVPTYSLSSTYHLIWNEFIIPAGILQYPFFSTDDPKMQNYLLYAKTGSLLAKAIIIGVFHPRAHRYYPIDAGKQNWYSTDSARDYKRVIDCYKDQLKGGQKRFADRTALYTGAVRAMHRAYKKWTARKGITEKLLPGVSNSIEKTMFLAYAQNYCKRASFRSKFDHTLGIYMDPEEQVNILMKQTKHFGEAFQCTANSRMTPIKQCEPMF